METLSTILVLANIATLAALFADWVMRNIARHHKLRSK